ncbi:hypothetical protein PVOR_30033 [Paenibacillus vortex V453]|uniref:Uncharacterized protein n=1 Tax=Paenibacillus vortex V453 TaxID=715225 RepID=A0A2R9SLW2_9BACL|nr:MULTISPECIES: hypothetical protein [Paenibacillus]AWP25740.1 hypothetical protein B9D94_03455 [Paenibacillus sp. Cedars]EFU38335.1 hypothetical protein PVOR_30033 [Paenibacillus vortex V453]OMF77071.1 hypothetical protein BK142_13260 [Paenibacillus glucanolyticus]
MWNVTLLMVGLLIYSGGGGVVSEPQPQHTAGISQPPIILAASDVGQAHISDNSVESYGTLNGISLTDSKKDVIRKLGTPARTEQEDLSGITKLHYKDMEVGVRNGYTEYVHVKPSADSFQVEDQSIGMTTERVRASLGKPYFKAEDGDVYLENQNALKVYVDRDTGQIEGIDLFFDYSQ